MTASIFSDHRAEQYAPPLFASIRTGDPDKIDIGLFGFRAMAEAEGIELPADDEILREAREYIATSAAIDQQAAKAKTPLRVVTLDDLETARPEPPEFWIHGILPARAVTLLGAHGGTGKSTLAAAIGAHLAAGKWWYGLATKPARVAFVSLEDDAELVRYRLRLICETYGLDMAEIGRRMFILDGTDFGALVEEFNEGGIRSLVGTAAMKQIEELGGEEFPDVWIVDNASDAFDANENERRLVRAFIRRLASLARRNGGAVLLLAHLPKDAAKAGGSRESYSGSTAWHNSARSRLALIPDDELVKLEHQKSNFGKCIEPLYFRWTETGVLVPAAAPEKAADEPATVLHLDGDVLAAIERAATQGTHVPTATAGAKTAGAVLREILGGKVKASAINAALIRLEQRGAIQRTEIRNSNRKFREVWTTAPNAPNAPNDGLSAMRAMGAEARAECAELRIGGMGERARTLSAQKPAEVAA